MKAKDVKLGGTYYAKVSGNVEAVKLVHESRFGGWDAVNLRTGRSIRIKSAARLRGEVGAFKTVTEPQPNYGTPTQRDLDSAFASASPVQQEMAKGIAAKELDRAVDWKTPEQHKAEILTAFPAEILNHPVFKRYVEVHEVEDGVNYWTRYISGPAALWHDLRDQFDVLTIDQRDLTPEEVSFLDLLWKHKAISQMPRV